MRIPEWQPLTLIPSYSRVTAYYADGTIEYLNWEEADDFAARGSRWLADRNSAIDRRIMREREL